MLYMVKLPSSHFLDLICYMYKITSQVEFFTDVILKVGVSTLSGKMKSREGRDVYVEF